MASAVLEQVADFRTPFLKSRILSPSGIKYPRNSNIFQYPVGILKTSTLILKIFDKRGVEDLRVPLTGPFGTGPREGRSESIR